MKIHFVSINSISSIPLVRYLVNFFGQAQSICIVETYIRNANSYFVNRKEIELKPLVGFEGYRQYIDNVGKNSLIKYFKLFLHFIRMSRKTQKSVIYTTDYQVIFVLKQLLFLFKKRPRIIYHQFEIIELKLLGKISGFMFTKFKKNIDIVDLLIFPEINRLNYFKDQVKLENERFFLMPNTGRKTTNISSTNKWESIIPSGHKVCLHVGTVGGDNHYFENYLKLISKFQEDQRKVTFIFVGRMTPSQKEKLMKRALQNVKVVEAVPHEELQGIYDLADMGVILYKGSSLNYEYCAPNKLYEFWSFGIPVIGHQLKGLVPIFKEEFQGQLIDFENENEAYEKFLLALKKKNKENLKKYFESKYDVDYYLVELKRVLLQKNIYEIK